jgi:Tfp pilus assembly protein PilO
MSNVAQRVALIAAAFLIVLGGVAAAIYSRYNEKQATMGEIQKLREEIAGYEKRIAMKEAKQKQKDDIEDNFAELVEILPQASAQQQDRIYQILTQIAANTRVKPKGLVQKPPQGPGAAPPPTQPQGKPQPQFGDAFQRTELAVQFEGTFANFMKFLNMVEAYPQFLKIDEIEMKPVKKEQVPPVLDIKLTLSTFSYVVR